MLFIIVLYKCNLSESNSYLTIIKSLIKSQKTGTLFVFDNSPDSQIIKNDYPQIWNNIEYVHCPENSGLGIAYNQGAQYAFEHGFRWIMLLDQDTKFEELIIEKIDETIQSNSNIFLITPMIRLENGIYFSPTRYKHKRGYKANLKSGVFSLFRYSPVNSGMVINVDGFIKSGGYNPEIKLDFSDFQFIERFRKFYGSFYLIDSIAIQNFSNDEKDIVKLKARFRIYCECAKKCNKLNLIDHVEYFYSVFRHAIGLIIKTRNFSFMRIFICNYFF